MDKKEFQRLAVRTESVVDEINVTVGDGSAFLSVLGAYNELGDILDAYKKHIFYGRELDRETLMELCINALTYTDLAMGQIETAGFEYNPLSREGTLDMEPRIFHALLGSLTEHTEIGQAMFKALMGQEELDLVNVCEELGDSDWYKALFYEATGIDWNAVQSMIIKKLEIRFAEKIFTDGEANERDLVAERELLEASIKEAVDEYKNRTV